MSSDRMLQRTVLQVIANPYLQSLIALPVLRRVGTVLGAGEGVVEATCLDNDLNGRIICPINISIEHSRTLRCLPFQSKKASHKVFSRLEHSILRLWPVSHVRANKPAPSTYRGSDNNLAIWIIELRVHVRVQDTCTC